MRRLSWIVLPIAMLTVTIVALTSGTGVRAEEEEKAKPEEREWGEEVNGCRVSIQLKDYDEKKYGPVTISTVVKNTGKGTVTYFETLVYRDFVLTVKHEDGEEVPLTAYGKKIRISEEIFRRMVVTLAPGEQEEHTLIANAMHVMTPPGTYAIAATIEILDPETRKLLPVKSNTITVKRRE